MKQLKGNTSLTAEDIGADLNTVGLEASPTNVFRSFTLPERKRNNDRR